MLLLPFKPMELKILQEPFDSDDFLFQIKWDGVRCITNNFDGHVRLFNRNTNERTDQYPEIVSQLESFMPDNTMFDGEIVALGGDGKPDFYRLLKRDFAKDKAKIVTLAKSVSVYYMVFDIIYLKGQKLTDLPLTSRLISLTGLIPPLSNIHLVDSIYGKGCMLFDIAREQQLEGIVAKKLDSRYISGEKTNYWYKIKSYRHLDAFVGGFTELNGISLLLGIPDEMGLLWIGNAGTGLKQSEWRNLQEHLNNISTDVCPFINCKSKPQDITWVEPKIKVSVRYLEQNEDFKLRHPVIEEIIDLG